VLAITSYHVQIINRLSSGYIAWYWWIASAILSEEKKGLGLGVVGFFVMYAGIQGGLFASFLPPA
jgi:phosphatidylinositol glycan class V